MRRRIITQSSEVGHVMLSDRGEMLGLDAGFCAMMRADSVAMIGRCILEITVPADRPACAAGMAALRDTGQGFVVAKRFLRADGAQVWAEQTTTLVRAGTAATIFATVKRVAEPGRVAPSALLRQARFLCEASADRAGMFGPGLFANPSWDVLLKAYVAEAEGRTLDIDAMAQSIRNSPVAAERWARALVADGVLEIEASPIPGALSCYRLSGRAHDRLERYLSQRLLKLDDRLRSLRRPGFPERASR